MYGGTNFIRFNNNYLLQQKNVRMIFSREKTSILQTFEK